MMLSQPHEGQEVAKFTDHTAVVGCIVRGNEPECREEVDRPVGWSTSSSGGGVHGN